MNAERAAYGIAFAALVFTRTLALAAPPAELDDSGLGVAGESSPALAVGASGKIQAADDALRALGERRQALTEKLAGADGARLDEGRRARRLAREILVAELHGHALAGSPRELVQNANLRSGLRRVAARTLAAHATDKGSVQDLTRELAALDVDEARIKGERAVAETELRLEQEEARRRRETLHQIFETGQSPVPESSHARIRVAEAGGDEDSSSESFASRKGTLPLPIQRKCRIKSKRDPDLGGAYLAFTVKAGSNVRAVAAGTVVFADELAPYGKLVVVDHGQSYFTVYGGLSRVGAANGESVSEGGVIGAVGEDNPLVFQLRVGSRTTSGLSWFASRRKPREGTDVTP